MPATDNAFDGLGGLLLGAGQAYVQLESMKEETKRQQLAAQNAQALAATRPATTISTTTWLIIGGVGAAFVVGLFLLRH